MARRKPKVARDGDPLEMHHVMIELSKARAMASVLWELDGGNHTYSKETQEWLRSVVHDALRKAIDDAGAAFRNSTTGQEWLRVQLDGLAKQGV